MRKLSLYISSKNVNRGKSGHSPGGQRKCHCRGEMNSKNSKWHSGDINANYRILLTCSMRHGCVTALTESTYISINGRWNVLYTFCLKNITQIQCINSLIELSSDDNHVQLYLQGWQEHLVQPTRRKTCRRWYGEWIKKVKRPVPAKLHRRIGCGIAENHH